MSFNGKLLNTVLAVAFIFTGYLSLKTGRASKDMTQVLAYILGAFLVISGLGMIFAPEGMKNITGPLLGDAYPATTVPIAQEGWTSSTTQDTILQKGLDENGYDNNEEYSGYSPTAMDYTFGLPMPQ